MKIHYLMHHPLEGLENIGEWALSRGHALSGTSLYKGEDLPLNLDFNWLIIMGGPMSVHDERRFLWLYEEKRFIEKAVRKGKTVLGICLGAQLIADVLGAGVYRNPSAEIGWFPVRLVSAAKKSAFMNLLPEELDVFQWHEETFDIPRGCRNLAGSHACAHQAFEFDRRVLALQFHLEVSEKTIESWLVNGLPAEKSPFVQNPLEMLNRKEKLREAKFLLGLLLNQMEKRILEEQGSKEVLDLSAKQDKIEQCPAQ